MGPDTDDIDTIRRFRRPATRPIAIEAEIEVPSVIVDLRYPLEEPTARIARVRTARGTPPHVAQHPDLDSDPDGIPMLVDD
jgi:hypothetical protein